MRSIVSSRFSLFSAGALGLCLLPFGMASCAAGSALSSDPADQTSPALPSPESAPAPAPAPASAGDPGQKPLHELLAERLKERVTRNPYTSFSGVVTGLGGKPLKGVTVSVAGHQATTDAAGAYNLPQVEIGSYVASFSHPDYVFAQRRLVIEPGDPAWLIQSLLPRSQPQHLNADKGGVVKDGRVTLHFEPQDLEFERDQATVHGDVEVVITMIDPRVEGHIDAAPAALEGMTTSGEQVGLFSYGMLEVELLQNGRKVNVRRGETVEAALDVSADASLSVGARIPMWHHDTDSGIWAQERATDAVVQMQGSSKQAVAMLPHFSAWNWDVPADGACAPLIVPTNLQIAQVRVVSTDASGNVAYGYDSNNHPQGWTMTFECTGASGMSSRCGINVPAGSGWSGGDAYFKLQALPSGSNTWCDFAAGINGSNRPVLSRNDVNQYLASANLPAGSWCGSQLPRGGWVSGDFRFTKAQYKVPISRVSLGISPSSSSCPGIVGVTAVTGDSGFATMAARAVSSATANDADNDGVSDGADRCLTNRNTDQSDTDANGIGDNCEDVCYVPASDPNASLYDADGDGVDDLCDNQWNRYNPSQY